MFGTHDQFDYLECANCGCLRLLDLPGNWSRYYPPSYYSLQPPAPHHNALETAVLRAWTRSSLNGNGLVDRLLARFVARPRVIRWARQAGITLDSPVLDVGSGGGQILSRMHQCGFKHLTGVDPFVSTDPAPGAGYRLLKKELTEIDGHFDFIMLHHSFEHMADHDAVLAKLRQLVAPGGSVLIRTPVVAFAWRKYGVDWVQLDPPRHLLIHTAQSIQSLAERARFALETTSYESNEFQFWASEQYHQGIPLHDPRSYAHGLAGSIFTKAQIQGYREQAARLNQAQDGDSAAFLLRPR